MSCAIRIQTAVPHPVYLRFSVIVCCQNIELCLPRGLFPSGFPTKIWNVFLISVRATYPAYLVLHDLSIPWQSIYIHIHNLRGNVFCCFFYSQPFTSYHYLFLLNGLSLWSLPTHNYETRMLDTHFEVFGGSRSVTLEDHKECKIHPCPGARVYLVPERLNGLRPRDRRNEHGWDTGTCHVMTRSPVMNSERVFAVRTILLPLQPYCLASGLREEVM
jgi:hypothetical protein